MLTTLINPDHEVDEIDLRAEQAEAERRAYELCEAGEREKEEDLVCQRFAYMI
jgi:hypothetical protein